MSNEAVKQEAKPLPRYIPASDILERPDGFHIHVDMPGVRKEDLVIDLNKNEVTVIGKTSYPGDPRENVARRYSHVEFGGGECRRTFTLSDTVDRDKITAQLKDGVLDLFLPKSERTKPKRIEIVAG